MFRSDEERPCVGRRPGNRVSSAVWPASMRRGIATGRTAQRRRDWLMQRRWLIVLVDTFSLRVIFVLTTCMVVISSLLVAALGLSFWYLLLAPLLLYTVMTLLPLALVSKAPGETPMPTLSASAREFKSFSGLPPAFPGGELHSAPGYFQELPQSMAHLAAVASSPATPMPTEQPLVRVLETYDLRESRVRHFFEEMLRSETGEYMLPHQQRPSKDFWHAEACPSTQQSHLGPLPDGPVPLPRVEEGQPRQSEQ